MFGRQALGHYLGAGKGLGSDRKGGRAGKDRGKDSGCQEAQGCGVDCHLVIFPRVQQPTCAFVLLCRKYENKVFHVYQSGKKSEALKPRDAHLGPHPTHASASDTGFKTNFISSIYGRRGSLKKAVSQSQSDHLTSGQRESRWAEISEPGKPSERTLAWVRIQFGNPEFLGPVWLLVTGLSVPQLPGL